MLSIGSTNSVPDISWAWGPCIRGGGRRTPESVVDVVGGRWRRPSATAGRRGVDCGRARQACMHQNHRCWQRNRVVWCDQQHKYLRTSIDLQVVSVQDNQFSRRHSFFRSTGKREGGDGRILFWIHTDEAGRPQKSEQAMQRIGLNKKYIIFWQLINKF